MKVIKCFAFNMKATLTQRQAQFLITRLSQVAKGEQTIRQSLRRFEGELWNNSDKDSAEGEAFFYKLNLVRDGIRQSKLEEAKLNDIIRSLRKVTF